MSSGRPYTRVHGQPWQPMAPRPSDGTVPDPPADRVCPWTPAMSDEMPPFEHIDTVLLIDDSVETVQHGWSEVHALADGLVSDSSPLKHGLSIYFANQPLPLPTDRVDGFPAGRQRGGHHAVRDRFDVSRLFSRQRRGGIKPPNEWMGYIVDAYMRHLEAVAQSNARAGPNPGARKGVRAVQLLVLTAGTSVSARGTWADVTGAMLSDHAALLDRLGAPVDQFSVHYFQLGTDVGSAPDFTRLDHMHVRNERSRDIVAASNYHARSGPLNLGFIVDELGIAWRRRCGHDRRRHGAGV